MDNIYLFAKLASLVAFISCCSAHFCDNNIRVSELPDDIGNDVIRIALREKITAPPDCAPNEVKKDLINLRLYNHDNPAIPIILNDNSTDDFDPDKPIIILIPGWVCNINERIPKLIDSYLEKYDCNVIGIDWSVFSIDSYENAYCSAQLVAKHVAEFICDNYLRASNIHIVGHSIGGQIAGLIGQEVKKECTGEIGRITALDPAGPIYQNQPEEYRLDENDAKSVVVIHTNMGTFGYGGLVGTTDFFPNCGRLQPGCPSLQNLKRSDLIAMPLASVTCDHLRSADYMIESITSDAFVARSTAKYSLVCMKSYLFYSIAIMGEGCNASTPATKYLLWTNSQPPYAQGAK